MTGLGAAISFGTKQAQITVFTECALHVLEKVVTKQDVGGQFCAGQKEVRKYLV